MKVTNLCNNQLNQAIQNNKDIIIDNTHLNLEERNKLVSFLESKSYQVELINFTNTEKLRQYVKDNKERRDSLPNSGIINDQFIRQCINKDVPEWVFQEAKIALVDIDGTIAYNNGHRNYFDYKKVDKDLLIKPKESNQKFFDKINKYYYLDLDNS